MSGPQVQGGPHRPCAREKCDFLCDGGRGLGEPHGVDLAGPTVFSLHREFSPSSLLPGMTFTFPLLPPSSRSRRVWREPGQRLRENEDISQMACPRG